MKITRSIQKADYPTKTGRLYSAETLRSAVDRFQSLEPRSMLGEVDARSVDSSMVSFKNVSHVIVDLRFDEEIQELVADIETLCTPCGKVLEGLLKDGVDISFKLRGIGGSSVVNVDGQDCLSINNYKLVAIDADANPACFHFPIEVFQ